MLKTAEAVSIGHPDKTADYISSYILDRLIEQDPGVHYAVEVMIKDNCVMLGGEVKGSVDMSDIETYVCNALREIGYDEHYSDIWKNYAILLQVALYLLALHTSLDITFSFIKIFRFDYFNVAAPGVKVPVHFTCAAGSEFNC